MAKKILFKKTEDIRKKSAEEAIDEWVRNDDSNPSKEDPKGKSETKIQRLSIDIPENLHRKLKNFCVLEGISIKEKLINLIIKELNL
jgi:hypothetical protein